MRHEQFARLASELAEAAASSPTAITITLPTHRHSPDNAQDPVRVRNGARQAAAALEHLDLSRDERRQLKARLGALVDEVDAQVGFRSTDLGLACYVTTGVTRVVSVGHTPPERVIVSDEFSLAVPLADVVSADDVEVLVLTTGGGATDGARLYHLERGELTEADSEVFPLSWDVRDRNRSYADGIESDRRDAHIENFLRRVNSGLEGMFGAADARPLVLVGVRRLRDHWRRVAPRRLSDAVVADVEGNVDRVPLPVLRDQVVAAVTEAARTRALGALAQLERAELSSVATVADDIHRLAGEGRLRRLLVEEGATDEVSVEGVVLADRVALTVRRAYDSGAEVVIMPEGSLASSQLTGGGRIAAEVRW
jgi:hypothetical protein